VTGWRLRLAASAERDLGRLPERIAAAVVEFMTGSLLDDPARLGKPLHDDLDGYLGARRGAYRIVYRLDRRRRTVRVVRIDHRADVYRPRLRPYAA
jgi:mRNA interferase RelE/StbE